MDMKLSNMLPAPSRQELLMPLVNQLVEYSKDHTEGSILANSQHEFMLRYLIQHLDHEEIRRMAATYLDTHMPDEE